MSHKSQYKTVEKEKKALKPLITEKKPLTTESEVLNEDDKMIMHLITEYPEYYKHLIGKAINRLMYLLHL